MPDRANSLSALLVAWTSLHKLMNAANLEIPMAQSGARRSPNLERDLLTFLAAVYNFHPDSGGMAIAVARADRPSAHTTLYVTTGCSSTTALQNAFARFVHDLCTAYRDHRDHAAGACADDVVLAVYRFAYPFLREYLWDDSDMQQISGALRTEPARSTVQEALKKLKEATKDTGDQDIAPAVLKNMHELCGTIHVSVSGVRDIERGSPADFLLTEITGPFVILTYSRFTPFVSGACLSDNDIGSLMAPLHEWSIRWIGPVVSPAAFEAKLSPSAIAAWLEDYSRASRFLPWKLVVEKIMACCPEELTKTGLRYTTRAADSSAPPLEPEPGPAETVIIHCEITLLLWLMRHRVPIDKHIGCSGAPCWLCVQFVKALGTTEPDSGYAGVALSDLLESNKRVKVPWMLPADAPDAAVEALRDALIKQFRRDTLEYVIRRYDHGGGDIGLGRSDAEFLFNNRPLGR